METPKKIITEQDIRFVIAIIAFMIPILSCYYQLKNDLEIIKYEINQMKTNDLAHVQLSLKDMKVRDDLQDDRTIKLQLEITKLQTLIEKKIVP